MEKQIQKEFSKKLETETKLINKKETQLILKSVRAQGLTVTKLESGYTVHNKNGLLLIKAMNGNNGYLVRLLKGLFD